MHAEKRGKETAGTGCAHLHRVAAVHADVQRRPCLWRRRLYLLLASPHRPPCPTPHSPSPIASPLSNSLALCHSNLTAALSNMLSTSIQLVVLSTPLTSHVAHHAADHITATLLLLLYLFAPPHSRLHPSPLTIRVVTDLEPVTPTRSRPPSPSPSLAWSPILSLSLLVLLLSPRTRPPLKSAVVEKATLHLVSAAATVSAS